MEPAGREEWPWLMEEHFPLSQRKALGTDGCMGESASVGQAPFLFEVGGPWSGEMMDRG